MRTTKHYAAVAVLSLLLGKAMAQPNGCNPPVPAQTCANACVACGGLDNFTALMLQPGQGQIVQGFCTQIYHHTQFIGFIAGSSNLTLRISPTNCTASGTGNGQSGMEAGIFTTGNCGVFTPVSNCNTNISANTSALITTNTPLTVGGCYYLIMDGNGTNICRYTIQVVSGSTMPPVYPNSGLIAGPINPCVGSIQQYTINPLPCQQGHSWTLNGAPVGTGPSVNLNFPGPGTYTLCAKADGVCQDIPPSCITITVEANSTNLQASICEGASYTVGNQSFNQSGNYQVVLQSSAGCDSTVNLALTVSPNVSTSISRKICAGQSVQLGNQTFTQSGNYQVVFQSATGCDSTVNLVLTVSPNVSTSISRRICAGQSVQLGNQTFTQPGNYQVIFQSSAGCDSTVNLALTVSPNVSTSISRKICTGQSVQLGNQTFTQSGNYQVVFQSAASCDSTVNLALTVSPNVSTSISRKICAGQSVQLGNQTFTQSGNYQAVFQSATGCDSTVNLVLTVSPNVSTSISRKICAGQSVQLGNQTFTQSGNYQVVFQSATGCDSTVNLALIVSPNVSTAISRKICAGQSVQLGNQTFTQSGNYQAVFQSATGCDSTVNLVLTVSPNVSTSISRKICAGQSVQLGNQTFTQSGNYQVVFQSATGCDSTVNLALIVSPNVSTAISRKICAGQSVQLGNQTFTQSGNYQVVFQSAAGCDSTVNLVLTVSPNVSTSISRKICAGQSVQLGNQTFAQSGNYQVVFQSSAGCDSTVNLALTVSPNVSTVISRKTCAGQSVQLGNQTFTQSGNYQVVFQSSAGCDSTVNLALTVSPNVSTAISRRICAGQSVQLGNQTFTQSGNYQVVFQSAAGCDSTVNLVLTVSPNVSTSISRKICAGQSVQLGNQTFAQSGNYQVVFQSSAGCDSTVNLALTVSPNVSTSISRKICAGQSVQLGNQTFTQSGNYQVVFQSAMGCDSTVNLALTVSPNVSTTISRKICAGQSVQLGNQTVTQSGNYQAVFQSATGCDSTVNLVLAVSPNISTSISRKICAGQSVQLGSQTFTQSGNYQVVFQSAAGCDSTVNLALTVSPNVSTSISRKICAGQSVQLGNHTFTQSGNYQVVFQSATGCDSTVNLALIVSPNVSTAISRKICAGQSVQLGNQTFTQSGNYQVVFQSATGCDSTVNFTLTVSPNVSTTISRKICAGQSVQLGNQIFTQSGNYQVVFQSAAGCDSTVNLALIVSPNVSTAISRKICAGQSVQLGNQTFNQSGNYQVVFQSAAGCDSTVNLVLTVSPNVSTSISRKICAGQSVQLGNQTFTQSGNYQVVFQSATGCDSTVNLALTVSPNVSTSISRRICAGQSVQLGNQTFTQSGNYQAVFQSATGCDSTVNLVLAVSPNVLTSISRKICAGQSVQLGNQTFTQPGNHQVVFRSVVGCDSVVYLNLKVLSPPRIEIGKDRKVAYGDALNLRAITNFAIDSLAWMPPALFKCPSCPSTQTIGLTEPVQISVWASDAQGCWAMDEFWVEVEDEPLIYVPNVFRPDSPTNGYFTLFGNRMVVEIRDLTVFDRWGEQVFFAKSIPPNTPHLGWSGEFNGKPMAPAVFVWFATVVLADGRLVFKKGDVTLLR